MAVETREVNTLAQLEYPKKELVTSRVLLEKLNPKDDEHISWVQIDLPVYMSDVFAKYYPAFDSWYQSRILEGFLTGKRVIYAVRSETNIYGVSILKISDEISSRNKICSFYISPEIRREGTGRLLMEKSLKEFYLSSKPVLITVSEERLFENMNSRRFLDFLQSYRFRLIAEISDKYRFGKKEFIFERP